LLWEVPTAEWLGEEIKGGVRKNGLSIYRVSQEESARLREGVPYVKIYQFNQKHLCPKLNGYRDRWTGNLKKFVHRH
jgi:hypothetical protein